ncbi:lysine 2,3-aminomutase [Desulfohalotomaculum tongense]|uniref:glutamate 2,3-aminomutase n=1 Tax=Desulforadius tongensis TaxID=1216062 RepID=UPI00195E74E9|nr:glutamate 2,3-aminomutase [Desulforadius tongensis]MBM7854488.1 lysine 2,3-aminomutase [Desulforadius tongensis]
MADKKLTSEEKRRIALDRAAELRSRIDDYLKVKDKIYTGFDLQEQIRQRKKRILEVLGGTEENWNDWKWQIANRIKDTKTLRKIFDFSDEQAKVIDQVGEKFRWAISPYYASLMEPAENDPIWLQSIPSGAELTDTCGVDDPMGEEFTSPAPAITRRYPDRLIINVTNQCAMYCRHCQRRRNIGEVDTHKPKQVLEEALDYIRANPEIRDVLVTGGDALMLSDKLLDWLLGELNKIEHVEIKRLGTRTLVTLPQRITPELCAVIEKYPPIYINTQFNHPREVTPEVAKACDMLIKAGAVLGNQAVLLKNVNNDPHVMKKLNHELLKVRIRPYYIFHAKQVTGTSHFITSVDEGMEIMEKLRGYTSGLAIPTYIINAPNGYGKTPVLPQYILENKGNEVKMRTWEKRVMDYKVKH